MKMECIENNVGGGVGWGGGLSPRPVKRGWKYEDSCTSKNLLEIVGHILYISIILKL